MKKTGNSLNIGKLMKELDNGSRTEYYKSFQIESNNFSPLHNFPRFNTGKKPTNPSDLSRLERMTTLRINDPQDYLKLHETLENSELLRDGRLNTEKITCNSAGKATIICEDKTQKELLMKLLENSSYQPEDAKIKNNSFAIFGIPKTKNSTNIMDELTRRDKRFTDEQVKIKERFPIDKANDAVTFSCCRNATAEIIKKPYTFLGTRRYKICNFIDLIQCFKCAKYGHKTAKCDAKKPCCPNCAAEHTLDKCTTSYIPSCGNCLMVKVGHLNHSSWDVRCPYRLLWIRRQRECITRKSL